MINTPLDSLEYQKLIHYCNIRNKFTANQKSYLRNDNLYPYYIANKKKRYGFAY
jgi:hypothetical protein